MSTADITPTPDHVPCRHCGQPISWDEICWTHDANGFADCGLVMSGGVNVGGGVVVDPGIRVEGPHKGKHAEPVGEWS